ncbi:MAG: ABC transporter permease [Propionibacteriales bacterium]|nr:ABC transporter permease [Propionibacteriales bacterium]
MSTTPEPGWPLAIALVLLVLIAVGAATLAGLPIRRDITIASARSVVQLLLVSLAITAVLSHLAWSAAFALLMFGVAAWTSSRRIGAPGDIVWVAVAIAAGVVPVLALLLASGVIPLTGAALVPTAGIVIGGAMTANTLAGRRAFDELRGQVGGYEAALALGMSLSDATLEVVRPSAPEALTPVLDQTRTVGLVTLPGAYVGVLLGGGSPVEAGAAQVMVLVGLVAAETLVVLVLTRLVATRRVLSPGLRHTLPV